MAFIYTSAVASSQSHKSNSLFFYRRLSPMATNPKLRLLVEKTSGKVVYAEAGKDFVDFLFGLLELPIGSILSILVDHGMSGSGSLDSLYQSVRDFDSNYLQPKQTKNSILTPKKADSNTKHSPLLKQLAYPKQESYSTASIYSTASRASTASLEVDGYVQGVVTYMVKDDLSVSPMSTVSTIALIGSLNIKDISSLEEMNVVVDKDKGLKLLKASFVSTTVLTDVFLTSTGNEAKNNGLGL